MRSGRPTCVVVRDVGMAVVEKLAARLSLLPAAMLSKQGYIDGF